MHTTPNVVSRQYFIVLFALLSSAMLHSSQDDFTTSEESSPATIYDQEYPSLEKQRLLDTPQEIEEYEKIFKIVQKFILKDKPEEALNQLDELEPILQKRHISPTFLQYSKKKLLPIYLDDHDTIRLCVQCHARDKKNNSNNLSKKFNDIFSK